MPLVPILVLALVAVGVTLYLRQGRAAPAAATRQPVGGHTGNENFLQTEAGWFAMIQNSLEGPFSIDDLEKMHSERVLPGDARVRRRGDAQWKRLNEVIS